MRGLQCPHCTSDLCIRVVKHWLDITVNLMLILSAVLFGNGLGTGTDHVAEMQLLAAKEAANWNECVQLM